MYYAEIVRGHGGDGPEVHHRPEGEDPTRQRTGRHRAGERDQRVRRAGRPGGRFLLDLAPHRRDFLHLQRPRRQPAAGGRRLRGRAGAGPLLKAVSRKDETGGPNRPFFIGEKSGGDGRIRTASLCHSEGVHPAERSESGTTEESRGGGGKEGQGGGAQGKG